MGWTRFLFLGDIGQQMDLDVQATELRRLRSEATHRRRAFERADHQLDELKEEHDELKLAVTGLVRLLVAKGVVNRDEVAQLVNLVGPEA